MRTKFKRMNSKASKFININLFFAFMLKVVKPIHTMDLIVLGELL